MSTQKTISFDDDLFDKIVKEITQINNDSDFDIGISQFVCSKLKQVV